MNTKQTMKLTSILLLGVLLASACTQSYSTAPAGTPTLIPTGLFVSPYPSGQDPLKIIADLGTQTAQAQLAATSGTAVGTPVTPAAGTGVAGTDTPAVATSGTDVSTLFPVTVVPGGSTFTPTVQGGSTVVVPTTSGTQTVPTTSGTVGPVPSSYTLQKGEWPWCIARRYNLNPNELLSINGLSVDQSNSLMPGLVLTMPTTGNPFPGDRALHTHPATYSVPSSDTTISAVACYYGDVHPDAIASTNNLTVSSVLTAGQSLTIP
ncbi:MAG TPA: LysM peptidoglycan-binding domain-containing protein [Anaerolineales bacterium]|nr:LysM peptidoglycan-binding domain-containing protein [Anaerolineales bacterium]